MVRRLRKFRRLPATERWLLTKAGLLLVVIRVGMWLLPFRIARRVLAKLTEAPVSSFRGANLPSVEKVVWAVESAGRLLPWASTCLTEAVAAQVLLARQNHKTILRIGVVRGEGNRFEAHAWLESGGRAIIGVRELERYAPLVDLETQQKP